jgi:hypothetical protein
MIQTEVNDTKNRPLYATALQMPLSLGFLKTFAATWVFTHPLHRYIRCRFPSPPPDGCPSDGFLFENCGHRYIRSTGGSLTVPEAFPQYPEISWPSWPTADFQGLIQN